MRIYLISALCVLALGQPGESVTVQGAVTYVAPQECYLEAIDRSGGVFVQGATDGIALGDVVEAQGTLAAVGGERAIIDAVITSLQDREDIAPFGMANRAVGGAGSADLPAIWDYLRVPIPGGWALQWTRAGGAGNTGLLVRTWGTVKSVFQSPSSGARWFYLDDGSGVVSDLGDIGVPVYSDAQVNPGDFVAVTGISSVEPSLDDASKLIRFIRTRTAEDVSVLKPKPALGPPLSAEFNGPTLDPGWAAAAGTVSGGSYSLAQEPGSLTLVAATSNGPEFRVYYRTQVIQLVEGDWDLELKVRLFHEEGEGMRQWLSVMLVEKAPFLWESTDVPWDPFALLAEASYSHPHGAAPPYRFAKAGQSGLGNVPRETDTCFFRITKRGTAIHAYYSPDGSDYSIEGTSTAQQRHRFFVVYVAGSTDYPGQFAAAIDYIRFTPVVP